MSTEDEDSSVRDFINGFDEDGSTPAQLFDNIRVMNDFMVNVDRRSVGLKRQFDDIDRSDNARAETPRSDSE